MSWLVGQGKILLMFILSVTFCYQFPRITMRVVTCILFGPLPTGYYLTSYISAFHQEGNWLSVFGSTNPPSKRMNVACFNIKTKTGDLCSLSAYNCYTFKEYSEIDHHLTTTSLCKVRPITVSILKCNFGFCKMCWKAS